MLVSYIETNKLPEFDIHSLHSGVSLEQLSYIRDNIQPQFFFIQSSHLTRFLSFSFLCRLSCRPAYFVGILLILGYLCYQMFPKHEYNVTYLCYPIVVYMIAFGFKIEPFLRTIFETESSTHFNGVPTHSCSTNPETIRTEIDVLRTDLNNRMKQAILTSTFNAYYAAFIPCCFAQSYLFYDLYWTTQHVGFVLFGNLAMLMVVCFPANYFDVLHKAALHLGGWTRTTRVEPRTPGNIAPAYVWCKDRAWPPNTFVRHSNELFKSSGVIITAIPAYGVHIRFYVSDGEGQFLHILLMPL